MQESQNHRNWIGEMLTQGAAPLLLGCIAFVAIFVTTQNNLSHLEQRLTADEKSISQSIDDLEDRVHGIELDSIDRLATIETKLESIEGYLMEIKLALGNSQTSRSGEHILSE